MRRISFIFTIICITLVLCSCVNTGKKIEPLRTETMDFDINTAAQMVGKGEKIIADISKKDTVSRDEFKEFLSSLYDAYDGYQEIQWEYMFFYNDESENEQITTLRLNKDMFYPTIYHKDIEIVSASIKNEYYEDENLNDSILTIREEYTGTDKKLKDWYRAYLYKKNSEDNWVFFSFDGQMNFSDKGFTSDYLELK